MTQAPGTRPGWTGRLWAEIAPVYDAILDHPFIKGLATGDRKSVV